MKKKNYEPSLVFIFSLLLSFLITNNNYAQCDDCDKDPGINKVSIKIGGFFRVINSNGIPDHDIGIFPETDCRRPTPLKEQHNTYAIPAYPDSFYYRARASSTYTEVPATVPFGVAVNGIPFDPEAAEWWMNDPTTGWQLNPLEHPRMENDLDCNNAHVQPQDPTVPRYINYDTYFNHTVEGGGPYHYHALPVGLYEKLGGTSPWTRLTANGSPRDRRAKVILLGWSFDGAEVYGPECPVPGAAPGAYDYWLPTSGYDVISKTPGVGEPPDAYSGRYVQDFEYTWRPWNSTFPPLDMCNGHFAPTPDNPGGVYHYHITVDYNKSGFPYIPRCNRVMRKTKGPSSLDLGKRY